MMFGCPWTADAAKKESSGNGAGIVKWPAKCPGRTRSVENKTREIKRAIAGRVVERSSRDRRGFPDRSVVHRMAVFVST